MKRNTQSIERLITKFVTLGNVGRKTAMRYAYRIVDMSTQDVQDFCDALMEVKLKIRYCSQCATFCEDNLCDICKYRKSDVVCVVSYPRDVLSIERLGIYEGLYHVLHGTISPIQGRGPDDLRIKELLKRLNGDIKEIIIATNSNVEGDVTATYLARLLRPFEIKVTRIAQGIAIGTDIEYADEHTLSKAIDNRVEI
ncbi:MAG: recombination mediator RecR [Clostridiales bacterium]|jgi:recombination protein RecR|nr:recombination mediator RecR [Clostridiales bacterium]